MENSKGKVNQEFGLGKMILFMSFFPSIYVIGKMISTIL